MSKEAELIPYENFSIAKRNAGEIMEIINENVGPHGFGAMDLDRIKMPSGGSIVFEVPTLNGVEYEKELQAIVIHKRDIRLFWEKGIDDEDGAANSPPDCISDDGFNGVGTPGGVCRKCPNAQWGSAIKDGKPTRGQACASRLVLFLIQPGSVLPIVLSLPPTSLRKPRKFFLRMGSQSIPYYGSILKFSLEKTKNKQGIDFAEIQISMQNRLEADALETVMEIRKTIVPALDLFSAADPEEQNQSEENSGEGSTG